MVLLILDLLPLQVNLQTSLLIRTKDVQIPTFCWTKVHFGREEFTDLFGKNLSF